MIILGRLLLLNEFIINELSDYYEIEFVIMF